MDAFDFESVSPLQDAILKLGPLPRLLNDISVALRNPQLHMPTNHQPERPKDRLFTRPSFNRLMSSDFQSLMMRDLNRYAVTLFLLQPKSVHRLVKVVLKQLIVTFCKYASFFFKQHTTYVCAPFLFWSVITGKPKKFKNTF